MSKKNGAGKQQSVLFSQAEIGKLLETVPSNLRGYIDSLQNQISNMSAIGLALSKEKDMDKKKSTLWIELFTEKLDVAIYSQNYSKSEKSIEQLLNSDLKGI